MAVGTFLKLSSLTALALGLSVTVIAAAQAQEVTEQVVTHSSEPEAPSITNGVVLAQAEGRRGGWGGGFGGSQRGGGEGRTSEGRGGWSGGSRNQAATATPAPSPVPAPSWNNGATQTQPPTTGGNWNGGGRWTGNRGNNTEDRIGRSGGWRGNGSVSTSAPSAQLPQVVPAPSESNQWAGRNSYRRSGTTSSDWNSGNVVPPVINAQPQQHSSDNRNENARRSGWTSRNPSYVDPNRNGTYRQSRPDNRRADASRHQRDDRRDWREGHREPDRNRWSYNNGNRGWQNNDHWNGNSSYRRWNHDWRQDNRYNWHSYRNSHRDLYRMGRYYAPYRGYSYRRLSAGFYLDSLFFSSNYWINDPWNYRLPDVDGPYRWVRYYDDALLVDTYTGEVVDVIHNFFW